jgi:hypothetical protein
MAFGAEQADRLDRLEEQLRLAPKVVPRLFGKVIADECTRIPVLRRSGKAARIDRLIETGAWIDAAFALIELELPAWKVRGLAYENGEWLCSLSRQPNLPAGLDDTVDASHELLPLAILRAVVEARRGIGMTQKAEPAVPQVRPMAEQIMCCDNFA